ALAALLVGLGIAMSQLIRRGTFEAFARPEPGTRPFVHEFALFGTYARLSFWTSADVDGLAADKIAAFQALLTTIQNFINTSYVPDVEALSSLYSDYFFVGRGYGNLLSYGVFELNDAGSSKLFNRGRIIAGAGAAQAVDVAQITESVTHSWYSNASNNLNPASGDTIAQYPKPGGYSWLKAPRYGGVPYECGPLARMWVNGEYINGISVMDRIRARAYEARKLAAAMQTWLTQLSVGASTYTPYTNPSGAVSAMGLTEAPRGALGHWVSMSGGTIARYQVITPTCWTISPRDSTDQLGPLEKALMGTPVNNVNHPVEILRVIHSVDPCLDCATHLINVRRPA
ncbi:MAG: nickel-dependent hydrogenase large subunit, partial [Kiritimatiellaeota bacterium]|nr:nickel-dependent hydrogenase large subunit [Kiritimatiellota bacterium]